MTQPFEPQPPYGSPAPYPSPQQPAQPYPPQSYPPQYAGGSYPPPPYGQQPGHYPPPGGWSPDPGCADVLPPPPVRREGRKGLLIVLGFIVLVIIAVAAYFVLSGSSSATSSPSAAASKFLAAVTANDSAGARKVVCAADQGYFGTTVTTPKIASYQLGAVSRSDSTHALANVTVRTASGSQTVDLPVLHDGSGWKVCFSPASMFGGSPPTGAAAPSGATPTTAPSKGATPAIPGLPGGLPTSLPTDLSSLAGLGDLCGDQSDPQEVATTYVAAALTGITLAQDVCVYQHSVPAATTQQLSGQLFLPDGDPKVNGSSQVFHFQALSGSKEADVTVTKESDGKYWVTKVDVH